MKVAFVCVRNAGRSQMAHAFAERAVRERGLDVEVLTGGTDPADEVHDNVVAAMREVGIDLAGRPPREITPDDLADADVVVTMGCSAEGVCPATWRGDARDWDLPDPHGADPERTREIRDEIRRRVTALLDEIAGGTDPDGRDREDADADADDREDAHATTEDQEDAHAPADDPGAG